MLQDVREVEEGGTYRPPETVTLESLKKGRKFGGIFRVAGE